MSRPSNRTSPSTLAPGTVSCMRLRQRRSVDLPQPDGPMIAVTCPAGTPNDTSRTTRAAPKYASRDSAAKQGDASPARWGSSDACAAACRAGPRMSGAVIAVRVDTSRSIAAEPESPPRGESGGQADDEDESEEDEGGGPRLCMPVFIWAEGVDVDLKGKGGDGPE